MFDFANFFKKRGEAEKRTMKLFNSLMIIIQTKFKIEVPKF